MALWKQDKENILVAAFLVALFICAWYCRPIEAPLKIQEQTIEIYSENKARGLLPSVMIEAQDNATVIIDRKFLTYRLRPLDCEAKLVAGRFELPISPDSPVFLVPHNYIITKETNIEKQIECANATYRGMRLKIWEEIGSGAIVAFKR